MKKILEKAKESIKKKQEELTKAREGNIIEPEVEVKENIKEGNYKLGDVLSYEKSSYLVVDEEGNQIPCDSIAEAKILSLMLQLKEVLGY